MNKIVFDTCSLIYITKISLKKLITNVFSNIFIPTMVKKEVLYNPDEHIEGDTIKKNLDSKKIIERKIRITQFTKHLGLGELEAINLAKDENALLITDDKLALNWALFRGIRVKTTETLLILLLKKKLIDFKLFMEKIIELNKIKTLKPEVFQFILNEARRYK